MHPLIQTAKDRRIELRLSQRKLAKMLGVRQASISSMERGKYDSRILALDIIEALGGVFRVEFNDKKEENDMKFSRDIKTLIKKEHELYDARIRILKKVRNVCDFEIHLDLVPGDGWCFSTEISGNPLYMKMEGVLAVIEEKGFFEESDWDPFG